MGESTHIQWTDHTFNPWEGCTKVSPGCTNCYAESRNHRFGNDNWGKGKPRRRTSAANWKLPLEWNTTARELAEFERSQVDLTVSDPPKVFCASLADWLDDEVPIEWLADLLRLIHDTPNLDWQMLSKRPMNWAHRIQAAWKISPSPQSQWLCDWMDGKAPKNVWFGVSVENQMTADERIPALLRIPARTRFLSVEPMLGRIDLTYAAFDGADSFGAMDAIHWTIFGGESGRNARPCHVDWIRDGVRQCHTAGISPFVKQLGSNAFGIEMDKWITRLKDKKGGDPSEWAEDIRVREFPK